MRCWRVRTVALDEDVPGAVVVQALRVPAVEEFLVARGPCLSRRTLI
jgi:hypothetical protein